MSRSPTSSASSPNMTSLESNKRKKNGNTRQRNVKRKESECEVATAICDLTQVMDKRLDELRSYFDGAMSKIANDIVSIKTDLATVTQVTTDIKSELNSLRSEHVKLKLHVTALDERQDSLKQDVVSLQKSLQFASDQQDELKKQVNSFGEQSTEVLNDTIIKLEVKIDTLEQQARQCNLELCNIPERRSENLITLMETICAKTNCSLSQKDIIAIHRVPHAQSQNNKPKNIVVKLGSRVLRDNILSAFRLAKGLKTDQLGISGAPQPIYINEHLTLKNKQLFRACREAASKNKFKYVWVKHATILVREADGKSAIAIRSHQDILKIKPGASKHVI